MPDNNQSSGTIRSHGGEHVAFEHIEQRPEPTPNTEGVTGRVVGWANTTYATTPFRENDMGDLSTIQPFANSLEQAAAMQDPRYKRDALYRYEVTRRIAKSLGR